MASAEGHAACRQFRGERREARQLFLIEGLVLSEGHHDAGDADVRPAREVADERRCVGVGHPDTADAGIDTDVQADRALPLR
jgi:hypothetical protein